MVKASPASVATFGGKPLCDYAAKCPQLGKRSGDASKDKKLGQIRSLLQRIVDQCVKNPAIVLPLHAELMLLDVNPFDISSEGSWSGDYRTLERIPRDWKVSFLLALAKHHRLQVLGKNFMGKVEMDDPENIPRLFDLCVQAPQSLGCPPEFSDAGVASITLTERASELGDRLKRFTAASGFKANGGLDLSKGCFTLSFDDTGRCVEIANATGEKVTPPAHVTITKSFVIKHNHLDYKATVELAPSSYRLHEFFPDGVGFKVGLYTPWKKWRVIEQKAAAVSSGIEAANTDKARRTVEVDSTVLSGARQMRSQANLEKARTALAASKARRMNKKVVVLT